MDDENGYYARPVRNPVFNPNTNAPIMNTTVNGITIQGHDGLTSTTILGNTTNWAFYADPVEPVPHKLDVLVAPSEEEIAETLESIRRAAQ